ncbi:MAG: nuclear transport factor 2 family protein [Acidimicrobiales bacterium]|nr:nuclear transport factor 2 family protein [Acidimicrobiales bacterium]
MGRHLGWPPHRPASHAHRRSLAAWPCFASLTGIDADAELESVLAANAAFYDAFEAADLDAMSDCWEHSERVVCTHPGWPSLYGWSKVAGSYYAIFSNPTRQQLILTEVHASCNGDTAWVCADENLLGPSMGHTVSALNVFVRGADGGWKMVAHHGSGVAAR